MQLEKKEYVDQVHTELARYPYAFRTTRRQNLASHLPNSYGIVEEDAESNSPSR